METKICIKCNIEKSIDNYTNKKSKNGKYHLLGSCKICNILERREWYKNNKDKVKTSHNKYLSKGNNKKKNLKKQNSWREKNPEKVKGYKLKYLSNATNKITVTNCTKKWKKLNPNKFKEYSKKAHAKNVTTLSDCYIRSTIKRNSSEISIKDITSELILIKRKQLTLKRKLKNDTQN